MNTTKVTMTTTRPVAGPTMTAKLVLPSFSGCLRETIPTMNHVLII